jgi:hypothetical protein
LKDQLSFVFFPLSRIIDLCNEVLSFTQKEGESIGVVWSWYKQLVRLGPKLSISEAMLMQHFMHGLSMKSVEYLDMTSEGVFVQCIVKEGKSILEKILSVSSLEDLQPRAPVLSEDMLIITYPIAWNIPASLARVEFLQLTAPELDSNAYIVDHTPSPLSIEEDHFVDDVGDM